LVVVVVVVADADADVRHLAQEEVVIQETLQMDMERIPGCP
jgi:hypothetical protein